MHETNPADLGIKTIVNLRSFHGDSDQLKGLWFKYFQIYAKAWDPEDEDLIAFLKIMQDPVNQPVLVHCAQGADRTGYAVAGYRMAEQGWSAKEAISEMRAFSFQEIWTEIPDYLQKLNIEAIKEKVREAKEPEVRIID